MSYYPGHLRPLPPPPGLFERVITWIGGVVFLNVVLALMGWLIVLAILDAIFAFFAVVAVIAMCAALVADRRRR